MDPQGHSHRRHHFQVPRGLQHGFQSLLRLPQEGLLIEEIAAGVARDGQLGKDDDLDPALCRLFCQCNDVLGVGRAVSDLHVRNGRCDFEESVAVHSALFAPKRCEVQNDLLCLAHGRERAVFEFAVEVHAACEDVGAGQSHE